MARIFLAVADETCRLLLAAALESRGHTVETAGSYQSAVQKFALTHRQFPYTLVIADDCLPETEGETALDIENGARLVSTVLKIRKGFSVKKRWLVFYPLYPEVLLLSSLPGEANPLYRYFYHGKNDTPEKNICPALTIIQKGTELEKKLVQKVKEREITYWKRRYSITITGLLLSVIPGAAIIIKNSVYGISPSSFIYILGIGFMYVVLYFFQVKPYHPSRVITGNRTNGKKEE